MAKDKKKLIVSKGSGQPPFWPGNGALRKKWKDEDDAILNILKDSYDVEVLMFMYPWERWKLFRRELSIGDFLKIGKQKLDDELLRLARV